MTFVYLSDTDILLTEQYHGEHFNGHRCTGAFLEKPTLEEIAIHVKRAREAAK